MTFQLSQCGPQLSGLNSSSRLVEERRKDALSRSTSWAAVRIVQQDDPQRSLLQVQIQLFLMSALLHGAARSADLQLEIGFVPVRLSSHRVLVSLPSCLGSCQT